STTLSESNGESVESRLETASWSAFKGFGAMICHLSASFLASVKPAAPGFEIVMPVTSAGFTSRIFGDVSAAEAALLAAGFRWFDQYSVPVNAASTIAAASSPLPFIYSFPRGLSRRKRAYYLLRHHTVRPAITTASGRSPRLVMPNQFNCARVIVIRRSSRSLGRIEINSSSDASQLMVFIARSRFPLNEINPLATQSELPTTTKRPWGFSFPVR